MGFSKQSLIEWCAENAKMPAKLYWDDQWVTTLLKPKAVAGIEPFASRWKAEPDEMISMFAPGDINIVVLGGETQGAFKMIQRAVPRPRSRHDDQGQGTDRVGGRLAISDFSRFGT